VLCRGKAMELASRPQVLHSIFLWYGCKPPESVVEAQRAAQKRVAQAEAAAGDLRTPKPLTPKPLKPRAHSPWGKPTSPNANHAKKHRVQRASADAHDIGLTPAQIRELQHRDLTFAHSPSRTPLPPHAEPPPCWHRPEDFELLLRLDESVAAAPGASLVDPSAYLHEVWPHTTSDPSGGTATGDEALCAICLAELNPAEPAAALPCGHRFHRACVTSWLQRKARCPMCGDLDLLCPD